MPSAMTLRRLLVSCRVVWTNNGRGTLLTWQFVRQWQSNNLHELFHVLITRGDTRRCTKKRSAARSCGPAIRAIESLWREERGLCVSESARASEACVCVCMCVCARQQRYQRWYNSLNTQWQSRAVAAALYISLLTFLSFARSRQHASIHASPGQGPSS